MHHFHHSKYMHSLSLALFLPLLCPFSCNCYPQSLVLRTFTQVGFFLFHLLTQCLTLTRRRGRKTNLLLTLTLSLSHTHTFCVHQFRFFVHSMMIIMMRKAKSCFPLLFAFIFFFFLGKPHSLTNNFIILLFFTKYTCS